MSSKLQTSMGGQPAGFHGWGEVMDPTGVLPGAFQHKQLLFL